LLIKTNLFESTVTMGKIFPQIMGKFRALDYFDLYAPETLKQAHKNESVFIICLFFPNYLCTNIYFEISRYFVCFFKKKCRHKKNGSYDP
jgi:hypothetical protein